MRQIRESLEGGCDLLLSSPFAQSSQQHCQELLEKIAQGDLSALASLYQDFSPFLFGLILCIVMQRSLAEEVLLDVFKGIWQQTVVYRTEFGEALSWLLQLARTRALACRRSTALASGRREHPSLLHTTVSETAQTQSDNPSSITEQNQVRAALSSLSAHEREVIELAYFRGLTISEIAANLEISQTFVEKHLTFAMMQLRQILNPSPQEQR
jgi:RNA polymerase sigma-70 factor (ECF subfamily)